MEQKRPFVIIESPYPTDGYINEEYAKDCLYDSVMRGEVPISVPYMYYDIFDGRDNFDRNLYSKLGSEIVKRADLMAVYTDRGISMPMRMGIEVAKICDVEIAYRTLTDAPVTRPNKYR